MIKPIREQLEDLKKTLDGTYILHESNIQAFADKIVNCYKQGGKVIAFGNGGSYTDAIHIAGELVGRFKVDRKPLAAIVPDVASITAIGNDLGYELVFDRFVEACANPKDIVIALSTSGNSQNIINAVKKSKLKKAYTIGLTGEGGGKMKGLVDLLIDIPSKDTPRIQEAHKFVYHTVCDIVEQKLFVK